MMKKFILTAALGAVFMLAGARAGWVCFASDQVVDVTKTPGAGTHQTFFPMKKGTVLEYKHYKGNGKKELRDVWNNKRWTRLTVDELWGDSVANVTVMNETLDRLAKDTTIIGVVEGLSYGDVVVNKDEVVFDNIMWAFIPETLANWGGNENYIVELSGAATYPKVMNVGDALPDVSYKGIFYEQLTDSVKLERQRSREGEHSLESQFIQHGMQPPKRPLTYDYEQSAMITKRRVDGMTKVETPAGEFECYRITYDLVGPTDRTIGHPTRISWGWRNSPPSVSYEDDDPPVIAKYADYISPEVGLVKREKLNFRGNKAEEVMILESIK